MKVSVIMANYRGAEHLSAAISSVLRQTHADLELIVSDDASPDDSAVIVRDAKAADRRVHLIEADANAGPSAARNRALDIATGDWIAIVDSDDLLHPERFERLLSAAVRLGADIIADDLVLFGETPEACGRTLLQPLELRAPMPLTPRLYLEASGEDERIPPLGYLKPMIRRRLIGARRYDENLRIGEDYDFVLGLLLTGARFLVVPDPMYLYRRHSGSISHRLSEGAVRAMLAAHDRVAETAGEDEIAALAQRRCGLEALLRYERLVGAIRAGHAAEASKLLFRHPGLALLLGRSLIERLSRHATPPARKTHAELRLAIGPVRSATGGLTLPCQPVPPPGATWSEPPARMAAELSRLSARHHLRCVAEDAAGEWAAGLLPLAQADRLTAGSSAARLSGPVGS
jgi:succinoglycan biosynthesis protein ExoO